MNTRIDQIKRNIEPLRQQIINHPVYSAIESLDDLQMFMQSHVFAVWDFMSLLKSLQNNLTCTSVPWLPKGSADIRYLINEIVTAEESDLGPDGKRKSHFELYLEAMAACGASTQLIEQFINALENGLNLSAAMALTALPDSVQRFINFTFQIINSGQAHLQSAVFTFGREDLIPQMFLSLVRDLSKQLPEKKLSTFKYYLERHIELDGDHHSQLALEMTAKLCGDNEQYWEQAEEAIKKSLKMRIELWDGVLKSLAPTLA